ncbi:hypothetical protein BKA83DRAFT_4126225 [Pisolithus microcarpus]|nr:hypothetical protein BKA83DRAFT_4126225 [Pisolithus microcarpus]
MKVAVMKKGYQRIGNIKDKMEFDQSSTISGSRHMKPHTHLHPASAPKNPSQVNDNVMSKTLTSLADMEDNASGVMVMKGKQVKAAKPQVLCEVIISTGKQTASPSLACDAAPMCISLPKMFVLAEAMLFFANVLTTASSDDKVTLSKCVKSWFKSQLPDDWNLPAHQPDDSKNKGGEANKPLEPVFEPKLLDNWNSPVDQPSIPEYKGGEANELASELVVLNIPTLRNVLIDCLQSQCTTAMAKDHEANATTAGLTNIKRKVTKMDDISTSEVKLDDDLNNAIHVLGWKGAVKSSIMVTKTMPKKIKMEASGSSFQTQAIPMQTCFNNSDLPTDLHKNQKWRREDVPMLILWAGNQENTFSITKQETCDTLQEIIPVVYPILKNTANTILPNSPMVSVLTKSAIGISMLV